MTEIIRALVKETNPMQLIYASPKQAAQMVNCSPQTIMKAIKQGRLPAVYLSRSAVRIKVTDLQYLFEPYNPERPRGDRRRKKSETK
jgi:excisionase family DNA binding protein